MMPQSCVPDPIMICPAKLLQIDFEGPFLHILTYNKKTATAIASRPCSRLKS